MKSAVVLACFCIAGPVALSYQTASNRGSIEGQVVNPDTGAPVRSATVRLTSSSGQPMRPGQPLTQNIGAASADTDEQGRFRFADLPAGSYQLMAARLGAQLSGQGRLIYLGDHQQLAGVKLSLSLPSIVTGKVVDEHGDPVQNVQISLLHQQVFNGTRQWSTMGNAQTSDLGEYRIPASTPGIYIVSAGLRDYTYRQPGSEPLPDKPEMSLVTTYYPGAVDIAQAAKVTVGASGTVKGIDITLRKVPTVHIRGVVVDPSPGNRTASVTLRPRGAANLQAGMLSAPVFNSTGEFELRGVTPGSYVLSAMKYLSESNTISSTTPVISASQTIEVGNKPIDNLVLKLAPGKDVRGTVKVEGAASTTMPLNFSVIANAVDGTGWGQPPSVRNIGTSDFVLKNVPSGRYSLNVNSMSGGYFVKSVKFAGREIPAEGVDLTSGGTLEIAFSTETGRLEGSVVDRAGKPLSRGAVAILPTDGSPLGPQTVSTIDVNGEFRFNSIRPGEYRLFAFENRAEQLVFEDPDFQKAFEDRSKIVRIAGGGAETVSLTAITSSEVAVYGPSRPMEQHIKASVAGQVVNSKTGMPVARAIVRLGSTPPPRSMGTNGSIRAISSGPPPLSVETDEQGAFALRDVEPGFYYLSAEHAGFLTTSYGRVGNMEERLVVGEGQQMHAMTMRLAPQGVIAGKVLNEAGEPVERARVAILKPTYSQGKLRMVQVTSTQTDDQGEYRVPNMAAGKYLVAARYDRPATLSSQPLPAEPDMAYEATYYPNVADETRAKIIALEAGMQTTGVDIALQKMPLWRIRGRVVMATGAAPRTFSLTLASKAGGTTAPSFGPPIARNQAGDFEVYGVAKGTYILVAQVTDGGTTLGAAKTIEVSDRHVDGITLQLEPTKEVTANIVMEDKTPANQMNSVNLTLNSVYGIGGAGMYQMDPGHETFRNLLPIPYTVIAPGQNYNCNCFVQSVRYGGHEIGDDGAILTTGETLEVVLSTKAATVEGTVVDRDGKPVPRAILAILPADGNLAKLRTGTADDRGRFYWPANAPGDYKLLAWESIDPDTISDPAVLAQADAHARKVTLDPNARETTQITAIPASGKN